MRGPGVQQRLQFLIFHQLQMPHLALSHLGIHVYPWQVHQLSQLSWQSACGHGHNQILLAHGSQKIFHKHAAVKSRQQWQLKLQEHLRS